jgi:hypothetical protein
MERHPVAPRGTLSLAVRLQSGGLGVVLCPEVLAAEVLGEEGAFLTGH